MKTNKTRVLVGMSGGVDSAAAALVLQQQGYDVAGATFRLWEPAGGGASDAIGDARQVCAALGIAHHVLDYRALFRESVLDYFAAEYRRGATPNPCVACNRWVKFGVFVQDALQRGFDCVATGHYASVQYDESLGRYRLRRGACEQKDQSYVLYTLTQHQLAHTQMPLGDYSKQQVRAMVEQAGLAVGHKADSQDICFVPDGDYGAFLEAHTGEQPPPGDFVDPQGNRLGRHRGIWHYTVGQRKGLGIAFGKPMYVTAIDPVANTVALAGNDALFSSGLLAEEAHWIDCDRPTGPLRCTAKIRYGAAPCPAEVRPLADGRVQVVFAQPQRAVTPGQAVVFYNGQYVVGGATIVARE